MPKYKVTNATNGKDGIAEVFKNRPDIILCDIMMPEVNGFEVLEELKQNDITKNIPFIFVTASVEMKMVNAAMNRGADGYLKKPFESEELLNLIRSFIKE